ncbi:hypothetical protein OWR29_26470 [Actinoplanes sp. Pm04-4]|uniref:Uncharacterized protein n=1 Tax=Paractinoplanes pyxinae TaxID=2997416 RepID=A0ABT4B4Z2_9ACTN|nr:hypothetical protein [Actinoplanes pyxinae]MCY1141558.1 hypothetical protein [Actinoplanes pyxinae]
MDRDRKMKPAQRFKVEAVERYEFLNTSFGFEGPDVADDLVGYHSGNYSIYVMHDDFDKSAITVVTRRVGESTRRAELSCLYASAGLGPAQDIKTGARTSRLVADSIASQADKLKLVLPILDGQKGEELMETCHARY